MEDDPPAPSTNSTDDTMAFSSTTTPQSVQTDAPEASCISISLEPQFGQKRFEAEVDVVAAAVAAGEGGAAAATDLLSKG